jgi:coproporphyrinogen III oxidase
MSRLFVALVVVVLFVENVFAFRMINSHSPLLRASTARKSYGRDAPGFDTHKAIDQIPESLVNTIEGNDSMRRRFETVVRTAQVECFHFVDLLAVFTLCFECLKNNICKAIEDCDGVGKFRSDAWVRENGGGGISRVLSGGKVWEKAGVNLSVVYGNMPKEALTAATERGIDRARGMKPGETVPFFACGLSSVMHPRNPHCPTMHFNYRYFETDGGAWWFGGGTDITPSYLDKEDIKHFHGTYKETCDKHDTAFYPKFKKWADDYFTITHRGETRGLGGIFYDDLNDRDPEKLLALAQDGLNSVVPAYVPIIEKHKNDAFTEDEKRWQLLRRGRYTEFNLIYDRGTIFGLKTGGRVESILMSLPEVARWEYDHHPAPGSKEDEILQIFKNPTDWA